MAYYILKSYKLKVEPFEVFAVLNNQKNCFFLDSSLIANPSLGRYSFLGIDPFYVLETKQEDPFKKLREMLGRYKFSLPGNPFPFLGGALGYLSYDLGFIIEKSLKQISKKGPEIPDCYFGFYNSTIIIDHLKHKLHIFSLGFPEKNSHLAKTICQSNFKKICALLSGINPRRKSGMENKRKYYPAEPESNFTKEEYIQAVTKAKEYIRKGDIYQVNLSQRFKSRTKLDSFQIYKRLRELSPSYFSAYFDVGRFQILSSSPERFLELKDNIVTTRPMKGTRPRGENQAQDRSLKNELLRSAKDKAELTMIIDLERNDLGRVCSYDSIKVNTLRELEKYSTVFQTTATISGELHKDKDRIDLLRASFPGGSITGCPKIRAMEIIEELEPSRRSIYTGGLGYLSFSGDMDFNILIRTMLKKGGWLYFGVGGGIVVDSKPEEEYRETLVKAKAMVETAKTL